ncbi:MAG: 2-hydroxyacid dehydrogenase [Chloroflexota bacterium]
MRVAVFGSKPYDRRFLDKANGSHGHHLSYLEPRLTDRTVALANGFDAVCVFVNDVLDRPVIEALSEGGVRAIALRCAGFNNVDLAAAEEHGIAVVRVPAYSPNAVAEHTVGLMLALGRKIPRAANRVRDGNFELEGLLGFDFNGRTAGIVGTGQIGRTVARILSGMGCRLLAHDPYESDEIRALGGRYVDLPTLLSESDVVTLHCPLTPDTRHLIDAEALDGMKEGVMLVNTSRGAVLDTPAVIEALKTGKIGYLGMDVYEEEDGLFFNDLSGRVIQDDVFARLLTFPNVIITGHQAFFTEDALTNIAETTLGNLDDLQAARECPNRVRAPAQR